MKWNFTKRYQNNKKGIISDSFCPPQSFNLNFTRGLLESVSVFWVLHSPLQEDMNIQEDHSPARALLIPFAERGICMNCLSGPLSNTHVS